MEVDEPPPEPIVVDAPKVLTKICQISDPENERLTYFKINASV